MLYNRTIYDLGNVVKLVADKIGPADRYMIIALLKNIKGYLERYETLPNVVFDDPVVTIQNLLHSFEDVNALKQPLPSTNVPPTVSKKPVKVENPVVIQEQPTPYKPARTLFSTPAQRPPVSRQIAGKKPPPLPPPQSESSDDDDYGDEFGGDDDSASYGSSRGDQQVEEEGIVEDSGWQPMDMLERALSVIANESSKTEYVVDTTNTTSAVKVTKKKKKGSAKSDGTKKKMHPDQFKPRPFLPDGQEFSNPTPRAYSSTYGGKKWPANQPFVCEYCRQIHKNIRRYKDHLNTKHKDEGELCCRYCRAHYWNAVAFQFHHCSKMHECTICFKRFSRPYKLQGALCCRYCRAPYKNAVLFSFHTCEKQHQCKICMRKFTRPYRLKRHIATHTKLYICRVTCNECSVTFPTAKECAMHIYDDHEICVFCDTCMEEFDPSECDTTEPERIFCKKCADKAADGNTPFCSKVNPNHDMVIDKKRLHLYNRQAVTKPSGLPDTPTLRVERKGRCEICAKDVGDLLKHNASVGHQMRQAEKEGVELPMYTCQVSTCGKTFLSQDKLNLHHDANHTGKVNYTCNKCGKEFYLKNSFTAHMRSHMMVKKYVCTECEKAFITKSSLNDHMVGLHRDKYGTDFKCPQCDMSFPNRKLRTKHVQTFHFKYYYKCTECAFETRNPDVMTPHMAKHHPELPYQKPINFRHVADEPPPITVPLEIIPSKPGDPQSYPMTTPATPSTTAPLPTALKITHEDVTYPKLCKACGTSMATMEDMKSHLLSSPTHKAKIEELGWFAKTNPCFHCNIEFVTGAALEEHIWVHHLDENGKPMFKCGHCNRVYNVMTLFRTHHDEKRCDNNVFECKDCGEKFYQKGKLITHWNMLHALPITYDCEICKAKFKTKPLKTAHMNSAHYYYLFACPECKFASKESSRLKEHIAKHHEGILYSKALDYRIRADGTHTEPPPSPKVIKKLLVSNEQLEAFNSLQALKLSKDKNKAAMTETEYPGTERLEHSGIFDSSDEDGGEDGGETGDSLVFAIARSVMKDKDKHAISSDEADNSTQDEPALSWKVAQTYGKRKAAEPTTSVSAGAKEVSHEFAPKRGKVSLLKQVFRKKEVAAKPATSASSSAGPSAVTSTGAVSTNPEPEKKGMNIVFKGKVPVLSLRALDLPESEDTPRKSKRTPKPKTVFE